MKNYFVKKQDCIGNFGMYRRNIIGQMEKYEEVNYFDKNRNVDIRNVMEK